MQISLRLLWKGQSTILALLRRRIWGQYPAAPCFPGPFVLRAAKPGDFQTGGFPTFFGNALHRPIKRKVTNRENPRTVPEQIGKIPEKSGKSQKGQKRTKKEGEVQIGKPPRLKPLRLAALNCFTAELILMFGFSRWILGWTRLGICQEPFPAPTTQGIFLKSQKEWTSKDAMFSEGRKVPTKVLFEQESPWPNVRPNERFESL